MALTPTVKNTGTCTPTDGTENILAEISDAGAYLVTINFQNLAAGATPDITEIRFYDKVHSDGTAKLMFPPFVFVGGQILDPNPAFPPVLIRNYFKVTLKQIQGTYRAHKWEILTW
jgi:hypothetical protein